MLRFDQSDWDSPVVCKERLMEQIRAVQNDSFEPDNPISACIDIQQIRERNNPGVILRELSKQTGFRSVIRALVRSELKRAGFSPSEIRALSNPIVENR